MKKILVKLMVFGLLFTITKCTVPDKPSMEQLRAAEIDKDFFKQTVDSLKNQLVDSALKIQNLSAERSQLINNQSINKSRQQQRINELDDSLSKRINASKQFVYKTLKMINALDSTILNRHSNVASYDSVYGNELRNIYESYIAFGQDVDTAFNKAEIVRKCQNRLTYDYSSNNQESLSRAEEESDIAFDRVIPRDSTNSLTNQPSNNTSSTNTSYNKYKRLYEDTYKKLLKEIDLRIDAENKLATEQAENARLRKIINEANNSLIHDITITAIGKAKKADSIIVKFKVNWPLCEQSRITIYFRIIPANNSLAPGIDDIICNCKNAMKVFDAIVDNVEKKIGYSDMMVVSSNKEEHEKSILLCPDEKLSPGRYQIDVYYNKKVVGTGGGTIIKNNKDEWSIQK